MTGRRALAALLAVVAGAAAVLSFDALRSLALVCGFASELAWLLPVVVDAGAAAGSLVWLGAWAPTPARRFARVLALLLLAGSVAGNALGHGLAAFSVAAPWWVVVLVSAVAPAVLGAVVHLAVLASGRAPVEEAASAGVAEVAGQVADTSPHLVQLEPEPAPITTEVETLEEKRARLLAEGVGRPTLRRELGISEHEARQLIATRTNRHQARA